MCPLTKYEGGVQLLYEAVDHGVNWPENTQLKHSQNEK